MSTTLLNSYQLGPLGAFFAFCSAAIALSLIVKIYNTLLVVREGYVCVIERFGRYNRLLTPGYHVLIPFVENCKVVTWTHTVEDTFAQVNRQETLQTHLISTQEILYDFPQIKVVTKDRLIVELNGFLFFKIVDPMKAVYSINDLYQAIEQLCVTSVRDVISSMTLDDAIEGKLIIQANIFKDFKTCADSWGVKVTKFDIQSLTPSRDVLHSIEMMAKSRRETQAKLETETVKNKIALAKIETETLLKKKEAETQEFIKRQQAETVAFEIESRANAEKIRLEKMLSIKGIDQQYLIQLEYTKAWEQLTRMSGGNKVMIIPMESAKFFGSSNLDSLFHSSDHNNKKKKEKSN